MYLVRAANGSLYCGISDDPHKRFAKHQSGKGARFFASSPAVALVYVESWPDKGEALRQERLIKKLILQVSGKAIPIGPYEPRTAGKAVSNAEQSLHALEKLGLDVSIEDTARKQK